MTASHFDFMLPAFPGLHEPACQAESLALGSPRASCFYARFTLETAVRWLYRNDLSLRTPYDTNLAALLHDPSFKALLQPTLFAKAVAIQKLGNRAAHEDQRPPRAEDAVYACRELLHVLYWLSRTYSTDGAHHPPVTFDPARLPRPLAGTTDSTPQALQALQQELDTARAEVAARDGRLLDGEQAIAALQAELAQLRAHNTAVPDDHDWDEADTRAHLIDLLLAEAGWDVQLPSVREFPVTGMPSPSGLGQVDYVLWDDDGRPLALVEAKRARKDALAGEQQARLYADRLEARFGRRPLAFCTNGYQHWLVDDLTGARRVAGFFTKAELQGRHARNSTRVPSSGLEISPTIVDRPYHIEAIRAVAGTFTHGERKALVVMATGTGKTRMTVALVDVLFRAHQVGRVLFLADRTSLVDQARRVFKKLLPDLTVTDLTKDANPSAHVALCTYQTMLHLVHAEEGGVRRFGPGHYDLVVADEAHRSIYQQYGALFGHFDAWLLGLTATPRDQVHRDTWLLFDTETGVPTFSYELKQAVDQGMLVPPRILQGATTFLQDGIEPADLPEDELEEWLAKVKDPVTGLVRGQVDPGELNKWLFNASTVDLVLEQLVERGLKGPDGDRLGKTILFARSQKHAGFVRERWLLHYPHLGGDFARVIHSGVDYAQTLIDQFSDPDKAPYLAISVDMLDTGIDVPEIVNLVFFKPVFSEVKYRQMLGRGTRLCKDVFGPGQDKTEFVVLDFGGNAERFGDEFSEADPPPATSTRARLFAQRLELATRLQQKCATEPDLQPWRSALLDRLHTEVEGMPAQNFLVRRHGELVDTWRPRERWDTLNAEDGPHLSARLGGLPSATDGDDESTRRFDLMVLVLQTARVGKPTQVQKAAERLARAVEGLHLRMAIPDVAKEAGLIEQASETDWWMLQPLLDTEDARKRLRGLLRYVVGQPIEPVYTFFTDTLEGVSEVQGLWEREPDRAQYRKKVEQHVRAHQDHVAVVKLRWARPLTPLDLQALESLVYDAGVVGGRQAFEAAFGTQEPLTRFIRRLVGLDKAAAREAFGEFLMGSTLSAPQIRFVDLIVEHLTHNGAMEPGRLWESPFTDVNAGGLDAVFPDPHGMRILEIVEGLNAAA
jgi:type I restriction enzyme R subunit